MANFGERIPFPVDKVVYLAAGIGQTAVEYFGQSKSIANIEELHREKLARQREEERIIASLPSSQKDGVRQFYEDH